MAIFIFVLRFALLLAALPFGLAVIQVRHDDSFHPDYILRISSEIMTLACRTRLSTVVNGTVPGPALYLKENQTTWVRVYNDLPEDNTTMHWHGLSSIAPYSDGSPQASQWPIKAQHFFDYEIRPRIGDAGSYYYHSHVGLQATTAAGPLIIEEADGTRPYEYDEERLLFFSELYNHTDKETMEGLIAPLATYLWAGDAESLLVNGNSFPALPWNETDSPLPAANATVSDTNATCHPDIIHVEPNRTYRFRAFGAGSLGTYVFAFEDHNNLTIVAADASYTQSFNADKILFTTGQRYDFLVHTKTEEELKMLGKTEFWIQIELRNRPINVTYYAVLSYTSTNASTIPNTPPDQKPVQGITADLRNFMEYTLEPLLPNGFPSSDQVTRQVYITQQQLTVTAGQFLALNNHTWTETNQHENDTPFNNTIPVYDVPYLVDIYNRGEQAIPNYENALRHGGWDPELNVYPAKLGEVIDIIIQYDAIGAHAPNDAHPFHLHGTHYWDLGCGPGTYNATANEAKLQGYNPVLRDTTALYRFDDPNNATIQGWRAWRLKATGPGVWMLHCHILQHMILGMQAVWFTGNAAEITQGTAPGLVAGYLTYGGDAYGNATHDPLVTHFYE